MSAADTLRLILLGAIWGGSFAFTRVVAPVLGSVLTAQARIAIAAAALLLILRALGGVQENGLHWRRNTRVYALIGLLNSAFPFLMFAYAALHIPAGFLAILNATAPLFGALLAWLWLGQSVSARSALGLLLGLAGVVVLAWPGSVPMTAETAYSGIPGPAVALSILACLAAAFSYAVAGLLARRHAASIEPRALAAGSLTLAAVILMPPSLASTPLATPTWITAGNALALGLICTALAYLLYYRLLANIGPARALTVTFLIPLFGLFWGALLLGEPVTPTMIAGCVCVLAGTALATAAPSPSRPATAQPATADINDPDRPDDRPDHSAERDAGTAKPR